MQGTLGQFLAEVSEFLQLPEDTGLNIGMSFGSADNNADANQIRTDPAPLVEAVSFF